MYYIGVDLGGTNIAAGVVDENGVVVMKKSVPTLRERPYNEIISDIISLCQDLMENAKHLNEGNGYVKSIGIGTPGTVDPENGNEQLQYI